MARTIDEIRTTVLQEIADYSSGKLTLLELIFRFPEDEEYDDEDLAELMDLFEHKPIPGIFPSSKRAAAEWHDRVQVLTRKVALALERDT